MVDVQPAKLFNVSIGSANELAIESANAGTGVIGLFAQNLD
ncbi:hypothetical protein [Marinobacter sp. BSs20148]|jgi:hypothetical protein|nr:hypothetical protein [Marinobacter sp. BSs20148]AFP30270.1 hypothetical protein MRBBS_1332 [Marinobacter sp. BSs20148]